MKTLLSILVLLFAVSAPKSERARPPVVAPPTASTWEWSFEDFECTSATLCWTTDQYQLCFKNVVYLDTGIDEFGDRSLAPDTCSQMDEPNLLVTFHPPMDDIMALTLTLHPDSEFDRPRTYCWGNPADVGDESKAVLLEPADPVGPDEFYQEGRVGFVTGYNGAVACRIYGVLDNVFTGVVVPGLRAKQ